MDYFDSAAFISKIAEQAKSDKLTTEQRQALSELYYRPNKLSIVQLMHLLQIETERAFIQELIVYLWETQRNLLTSAAKNNRYIFKLQEAVAINSLEDSNLARKIQQIAKQLSFTANDMAKTVARIRGEEFKEEKINNAFIQKSFYKYFEDEVELPIPETPETQRQISMPERLATIHQEIINDSQVALQAAIKKDKANRHALFQLNDFLKTGLNSIVNTAKAAADKILEFRNKIEKSRAITTWFEETIFGLDEIQNQTETYEKKQKDKENKRTALFWLNNFIKTGLNSVVNTAQAAADKILELRNKNIEELRSASTPVKVTSPTISSEDSMNGVNSPSIELASPNGVNSPSIELVSLDGVNSPSIELASPDGVNSPSIDLTSPIGVCSPSPWADDSSYMGSPSGVTSPRIDSTKNIVIQLTNKTGDQSTYTLISRRQAYEVMRNNKLDPRVLFPDSDSNASKPTSTTGKSKQQKGRVFEVLDENENQENVNPNIMQSPTQKPQITSGISSPIISSPNICSQEVLKEKTDARRPYSPPFISSP